MPHGGDGPSVAELALAYWRHAKTYYRKDGRLTGSIPPIRIPLRTNYRSPTQAAGTARGFPASFPTGERGNRIETKSLENQLLRETLRGDECRSPLVT